MSSETYMRFLAESYPLTEQTLRQAIQILRLAPGSRGLDAGCGIGLPALRLAEAVAPDGQVTGLDLSPEFLVRARETAEKAGLSERMIFPAGDVRALPFDDDRFDWAWSADCIGYAPMEPLPLVKELARVVKPGGSVVLLAWSSQMLLPGYPVLEAHLNATTTGIAPFARNKRPESHFLRMLGWFREAGLEELSVHTLAGNAHAPLSAELRAALTGLFEMRWQGVEPELTQQDRIEYRRLCLPESPDWILDHPDYYAFFTYSMFRGIVASPTGT